MYVISLCSIYDRSTHPRQPLLQAGRGVHAVLHGDTPREEQGSTVEQRAINEMIAADHGVTLLETFTDEGVSRTLADRPGLRELFDCLEARRDVRFLVVNELERITAGVGQRQQITSLCKRLGITLVTEDVG